MEDSDAHARRNVVMLSASILTAWWLRLDLPGVLSITPLKTFIEGASAGRLWMALALLLGYLILRYHFSPQRARQWRVGKKRAVQIRSYFFTYFVKRHLVRSRNKKAREAQERRKVRRPDLEDVPPQLVNVGDVHNLTLSSVTFRSARIFDYWWFDDVQGSVDERNNEWQYDEMANLVPIPLYVALPVSVVTIISRLFIGRAGLEVAFPYFLGIAALVVCLSKVG